MAELGLIETMAGTGFENGEVWPPEFPDPLPHEVDSSSKAIEKTTNEVGRDFGFGIKI